MKLWYLHFTTLLNLVLCFMGKYSDTQVLFVATWLRQIVRPFVTLFGKLYHCKHSKPPGVSVYGPISSLCSLKQGLAFSMHKKNFKSVYIFLQAPNNKRPWFSDQCIVMTSNVMNVTGRLLSFRPGPEIDV